MCAATATTEAGSVAEPAFVVPVPIGDGAQLWLIRHGETEWSRTGRHTGRTDVPLTPHGENQARGLAATLRSLAPVTVFCSPRQRAVRTAELAGLSVTAVDEDLAEWDYGDYEGRTSAEIRLDDPQWTIFSRPVPGGETAAQVRVRADRVLGRAARALVDGPVVLVAHGHICRVLGARWIGLGVAGGAHFQLNPASPCVLGAEHDVPVISEWNRANTTAPTEPVNPPSPSTQGAPS